MDGGDPISAQNILCCFTNAPNSGLLEEGGAVGFYKKTHPMTGSENDFFTLILKRRGREWIDGKKGLNVIGCVKSS